MEKLNMDDAQNDDGFLNFTEVDDDPEYPEYDTDRQGDKPWHTLEVDAGSKTLEVYHEEWGTLWSIRFKEGGQLPKELTGSYTDEGEAKIACDVYVASKDA